MADGTLITQAEPGDTQLVIGITGTFDNQRIHSIEPIDGLGNNDNRFFPDMNSNIPPTGGFLDGSGISFYYGSGSEANLFYAGNSTYASFSSSAGEQSGSFTLTSAAPEPSSWALMIAGLGGIGLALRRAKRKIDLTGAFVS